MANDEKQIRVSNNSGKELGASGTLIYSGTITGEEYNVKLVGRRGNLIYEEMRRSDSDVQELLKACKLPIRSVAWTIEAAGDSDAQQEQADFVENELFNRNIAFPLLLGDILTLYDFGFSLFEKVYELTEFNGKTRIGLKKIASRKQYSVLYWETKDGKPGITQQVASDILDIPQEKLLVFTNDKEGENYEGVPLLRYVYRDWFAKKSLLNMHLVALERLGSGVPVLLPPPQPDPKDVAKARIALRRMRANQEAYIELPAGWSVEMMDMKQATTKDILPTLIYLGGCIKKSGLAGFLEMGNRSTTGSKGASQDHSQLFEKSLEATANVIASVINENLIQQLCDFNFTDMSEGYPKIKFGNIGDEELIVMGEYLKNLAAVDLITPDAQLEDHLRQIARLPDLPEEYEKDYNDRILNARALKQTAMAETAGNAAGVTPNGQPTKAVPAVKNTAATPGSTAGDKATKNLPADARTKPTPVTTSPKASVRADALADAEVVKQKLIDVILG
jgi:hypothetical protein